MDRSSQFLELLERTILVADGAMGSYLHTKGIPIEMNFDSLNLTQPDLIREIHREYIAAGAQVIETNTFGANRNKLSTANLGEHVTEINIAGARLARETVSGEVFVAGSIGPFGRRTQREAETKTSDTYPVFKEQIEALVEGRVDLLILETFSDLEELKIALRAAKDTSSLPVICQMAFTDRMRTMGGADAVEVLLELEKAGADAVGGNCGSGPGKLLRAIEHMGRVSHTKISAFPNASFPAYIDGRYIYVGTPEYLADSAERLADVGANLIGGCCGTTPAHIRFMAERLRGRTPAVRTIVPVEIPKRPRLPVTGEVMPSPPNFLDKIGKEPIITVELDPPKGINYQKVIKWSKILAEEGADAISLGDNPLAIIRMSPFVVGHFIQKESGLSALVHCSCRDRNLLGQQSELIGAAALGIASIFAVTGDPASLGGVLGASSVFDTNSFGLIEMIARLNQGENITGNPISGKTNFIIGAAFNPNSTRLDPQIKRLERKVALGAQYVQTQPVFDENLVKEVYEKTTHISVPIFMGIMPLVSFRNASFLHNEVPGMSVPEPVRERMKMAEPDRGIEEGIVIAKEFIDIALDAGAPGIYIIPQFGKYEIAAELVRYVRTKWQNTL